MRTDTDLNPIGKPYNWFCQIQNDYLPSPRACILTGITPQQTLRDGLIEADFIRKIHQQMLEPNTCVAGYNSIRFDDDAGDTDDSDSNSFKPDRQSSSQTVFEPRLKHESTRLLK